MNFSKRRQTPSCVHREIALDDARRRVERVDNDLRAHVNQYEMETTMMEDLITTVHYGLVEHGGFVRFHNSYETTT